jgi:hypothetical protein
LVADSHEPRLLAKAMNEMMSDANRIERWKKNLQLASRELNWEIEQQNFPLIPYGRS